MFNYLVKKLIIIIMFIICVFIIFIASCTVNESTSKITILNKSNVVVNNIKIGNTVICSYIAAGATVDYYFYSDLAGQLTGNGVISAGYTNSYDNNKNSIVKRKGNYKLKHSGYFFDCEIFRVSGKYYITLRCDKSGYDYSDSADDYINGGYYKD